MFLTGYHGTTLFNAENIVESGEYNISNSETEWLGDGIYFYFDITDAYNWRNTEAILHSVIKIDNDEYLDIDSKLGSYIYNTMIMYISSKEYLMGFISGNIQKNQYAVMKMLWNTYPQIKVISASFPTVKTAIKTMLDRRKLRKEFCVRNNDCIRFTHLIRKDDL